MIFYLSERILVKVTCIMYHLLHKSINLMQNRPTYPWSSGSWPTLYSRALVRVVKLSTFENNTSISSNICMCNLKFDSLKIIWNWLIFIYSIVCIYIYSCTGWMLLPKRYRLTSFFIKIFVEMAEKQIIGMMITWMCRKSQAG